MQPITLIICRNAQTFAATEVLAQSPTTIPNTPVPSGLLFNTTNTPSTVLIKPSCITQGDGLRLRDRPYPDNRSRILARLADGTRVTPLAKNPSGSWIKVQINTVEGWVSAQYLRCDNVDTLPVEEGLPPLAQVPPPTRQPGSTQPPRPNPTTLPAQQEGLNGRWVGQTAAGEAISFQVDGIYVINLSVTYAFPDSCPYGRTLFTAVQSGLISPDGVFNLNIEGDALAQIQGRFTSVSSASGILTIVSVAPNCSGRKVVAWTAAKQ